MSARRAVDVIVAGALLLVLSPLLAVIALAVSWRLGSPVLFRQRRPGLYGELFTILKFRTMLDAYGPDGALLEDQERLTPLGRVLRRTSLDELPELVNVLRGEMSLIGPRPLLPEYLPAYTPEQARRHDVRPGITGLAQVSGRNRLGWNDKLRLDVYYVDHRSVRLDLCIVARTIQKVILREGIEAADEETAPPHLGAQHLFGDGS